MDSQSHVVHKTVADDYRKYELSNLTCAEGERAYFRQLKIGHYKGYINMHMQEQYRNEKETEQGIWRSYDMVYNLSKFKVGEEFLHEDTID